MLWLWTGPIPSAHGESRDKNLGGLITILCAATGYSSKKERKNERKEKKSASLHRISHTSGSCNPLSAFYSRYYWFHHLSHLPPPLTIAPFFHDSSLRSILSPLLPTSLRTPPQWLMEATAGAANIKAPPWFQLCSQNVDWRKKKK